MSNGLASHILVNIIKPKRKYKNIKSSKRKYKNIKSSKTHKNLKNQKQQKYFHDWHDYTVNHASGLLLLQIATRSSK